MKFQTTFILIISVLTGCAEPISKTTSGTVAGTALGAGLGAIVGNQAGNAGAGTAIGAAAGALGGALIGGAFDQEDRARQDADRRLSRNQSIIEENRRLIEELKRRGADVRDSRRGVVINLPDILFNFDRADLTYEAQRTINEISDVLRGVQGRMIAVEGHTDSIGTMHYNKKLSVDRANSVSRELIQNGVPSNQLRVRGFGEGDPIATNNTPEGRSRNRRVEVIVEN